MRNFDELSTAECLSIFLPACFGGLYISPYHGPSDRGWLVCRFEKWPISLARTFAEFVGATQAWLAEKPSLSELVRVNLPVEVGRDYVLFLRCGPYTSTMEYFEPEEDFPPPAPPEFQKMRSVFENLAREAAKPDVQIVRAVLARSLEPSWTTYFDGKQHQFVIEQLLPFRSELEEWSSLAR